MQKCQHHPNVNPKLLFNLWYCPECTGEVTVAKEVPFEDLFPAEQRVVIAKDVLARIEARKLLPSTGYFINATTKPIFEECKACVLGAVLICCVDRPNPVIDKNSFLAEIHLGYSVGRGRREIHSILRPYFSSDQLDEIEAAFEMSTGFALNYASRIKTAADFGLNYKTGKERMIAIMTNIIENNGTFNPPTHSNGGSIVWKVED